MKVIGIALFCLCYMFSNAQDTIYKRTGERIPAKVSEINITEISYKRSDLPDGPLFIINKNDIQKIKYFTGAIDSFKIVNDTPKKQPVMYTARARNIVNNDQISLSVRRGIYQYNGQRMSDRNILFLVEGKNQMWQNKEIELNISASKRNKVLQYVIGYGGAALGGIGLLATLSASDGSSVSNGDAVAIASIGAVFAGILVSSQIVSFQYKLKRIKHADKVAALHNQLAKIQ